MSLKLTEEIEEKIIDLYLIEEMGSLMISKLFDINKTTVLNVLKRNNVSRRNLIEARAKLYENGYINPNKGTGGIPYYNKQQGYYNILKNGKIYKYHRWVWEQHCGKIPEGYIIHHIDGDKCNNNIENLKMMTPREHGILHYQQGDYWGLTNGN